MKILFLSHTRRTSTVVVGSAHLAREFALAGHEVLYVSAPVSALHLAAQIVRPNPSRDHREELRLVRGRRSRETHRGRTIEVVDYVPFTLVPYVQIPGLDQAVVATRLSGFTVPPAASVLDRWGFAQVDLALIDEPGLAFMMDRARPDRWVYRITDIYGEAANARRSTRAVEDHVARRVDRFIAASAPVATMVRERWGARAAVVENGVEYRHFETPQAVPPEYAASGDRRRAVYVGSLDERFDWESVRRAAAEHPDVAFFVIGPGRRPDGVSLPSNVERLGPRPYGEVPAYLQHAHVGLLPLVRGSGNRARSPMKLYEYGAAGLPVVATGTEELRRRDLPFVFLAESPADFGARLEQALATEGALAATARETARGHAWHEVADRVLDAAMAPGAGRGAR